MIVYRIINSITSNTRHRSLVLVIGLSQIRVSGDVSEFCVLCRPRSFDFLLILNYWRGAGGNAMLKRHEAACGKKFYPGGVLSGQSPEVMITMRYVVDIIIIIKGQTILLEYKNISTQFHTEDYHSRAVTSSRVAP